METVEMPRSLPGRKTPLRYNKADRGKEDHMSAKKTIAKGDGGKVALGLAVMSAMAAAVVAAAAAVGTLAGKLYWRIREGKDAPEAD